MTETATKPGEGSPRRVLIVEDNAVLAQYLADFVLDLGYEVLGPCASVGSALAEIGGRTPSIALLDINLDGEPAFPIADALAERRVPYAFVSGYILSDLPEKYRGAPLFTKPIDPDAVEAWLVSTLGGTA